MITAHRWLRSLPGPGQSTAKEETAQGRDCETETKAPPALPKARPIRLQLPQLPAIQFTSRFMLLLTARGLRPVDSSDLRNCSAISSWREWIFTCEMEPRLGPGDGTRRRSSSWLAGLLDPSQRHVTAD